MGLFLKCRNKSTTFKISTMYGQYLPSLPYMFHLVCTLDIAKYKCIIVLQLIAHRGCQKMLKQKWKENMQEHQS